MKVGVVGLQGDVSEHIEATKMAIEKLELPGEVIWLKRPEQLKGVDAVIIPGGESTTISRLMQRTGLFEPIKKMVEDGLPVMGTCAGLIMLAKEVLGATPEQKFLEVLDVKVNRNAYGRQVDSFEAPVKLAFDDEPFIGVFIRISRIVELLSEKVKPLAWLEDRVVGVEQENIIGLEFHPELTNDTRIHEYFLRKVI